MSICVTFLMIILFLYVYVYDKYSIQLFHYVFKGEQDFCATQQKPKHISVSCWVLE